MGRSASSPPGKSAVVVLLVVGAVAAILNLVFAHSLHIEPLGLLSFGLFCVAYGFLPAVLSKRKETGNEMEGFRSVPAIPETGRPAIVRHESARQVLLAETTHRPRHALTIDLEDYFHTEVASQGVAFDDWDRQTPRVEASTHRLLELLERNETRATFFVLGWVAKRYPRLVQEIHRHGHEIGCHSLNHQLVCRMTPDEFYESTYIAKDVTESIIGDRVLGYRAPCFSITPGCEWAFDALSHLGFAYDSSVHPVNHPVYGNPTAPRAAYRVAQDRLMEFPIATWKVAGHNLPVGGGAYLRLLPYRYIYRGLAAWEKQMKTPAMLYLHPWEIDPYQPYIPLSFQSKVRQTWGTATMEEKLERLLGQFRFAPVREVHKNLLENNFPTTRKSSEFERDEEVAQVAG